MSVALAAQLMVSICSVTSVLLAGQRSPDNRPRFPFAPWVLLFAAHALFLAYSLWTSQPGFLLMNAAMVGAALVNFRASRKAARKVRHADG